MTKAEKLLWQTIRKKQLSGIQFYRQKVIGHYIVDFYAPSIGLVIEIDGAHHDEPERAADDRIREIELARLNLKIMRFSNQQVISAIEQVTEKIKSEIMQIKTARE